MVPSVLFELLVIELVLYMLVYFLARDRATRTFLSWFLIGLFFYSGIGCSFEGVGPTYIYFFIIFSIVFLVSYILFFQFFKQINSVVHYSESRMLRKCEGKNWLELIIPVYFFALLVPIFFPVNRVFLIFSPPVPDLVSLLGARFSGKEAGGVEKLAGYIVLILTPFFYFKLYSLRKRPLVILLLLFSILYIQYINNAYIGRGQILTAILVFLIGIWAIYPERRRLIVSIAVIAVIPMLFFFYIYQLVRISGKVGSFNFFDAITSILQVEWAFPRDVGSRIVAEGIRVDFFSYILWIFTLPIPKIFTGPLHVASVNVDISKIILGIDPGSRGFNIALTGLVGESVFIFGEYLFWLHAVFLAAISAFLMRLLSAIKPFAFLQSYVLILLIYNLNRGGIGAALSNIVNEFLVFYLFVFWDVFRIEKYLLCVKQQN